MAVLAGGDGAGRISFANTDIPAGNTVANTVTETTFTSQATLPPEMWFPGRTFQLNAIGLIGTAALLPTINVKVKLGSTVIGATGSQSAIASLASNQWSLTLFMTVVSVSSSGTMEVQGNAKLQSSISGQLVLPITNTSVVTLDMTASQTLSITITWGAASTSNTITLRQLILKG